MPRYSPFEMWSGVMSAFLEENDPILYRGRSSKETLVEQVSLTAGLPADLIESSTTDAHVNELVETRGIGHPHDVFVHAGDLATLTGCSLETGRNWLQKFHEKDLLQSHGDSSVMYDGETEGVRLYLPIRDNGKRVMRTLYELERGTYPETLGELDSVTPSQFAHLGGGRYEYEEDRDIVINVEKPEERSISLQDYINEQLHKHGLTPSSPKNFVYELRKQAGLI